MAVSLVHGCFDEIGASCALAKAVGTQIELELCATLFHEMSVFSLFHGSKVCSIEFNKFKTDNKTVDTNTFFQVALLYESPEWKPG